MQWQEARVSVVLACFMFLALELSLHRLLMSHQDAKPHVQTFSTFRSQKRSEPCSTLYDFLVALNNHKVFKQQKKKVMSNPKVFTFSEQDILQSEKADSLKPKRAYSDVYYQYNLAPRSIQKFPQDVKLLNCEQLREHLAQHADTNIKDSGDDEGWAF